MKRLLPLVLVLMSGCGGGGGAPPDPDGPYRPPLGQDIRLSTDVAGRELSVFPQIAQAGDRLYVVWYDRRNGKTDVYFRRSLLGGRFWPGPDQRLDTDAPGAASSNLPRVAAAGDHVYVAWEDTRGGLSQVRFNRSLDAGAQWLAEDVRLDRGTTDGSSFEVRLAAQGDRIWVVWEDDRDGEPDIYLNRSSDAGTTWLAQAIRLDTDVAGATGSFRPRIASDGDRVIVVWEDDRGGDLDVRANVSADGGSTWLAGDLRIDTSMVGGNALSPDVALEGTRAVVVWADDRSGTREIRASASADGGATWLVDDVRVDADPLRVRDARSPQIALRGSEVLVVWEDDRNGLSDVYANRSLDGGMSWPGLDARVDTGPVGTARSLAPRVTRTASHAFVVFADDREGRFDVLLQVSQDGGETWLATEIGLNTDPAGTANALAPAVVGLGGEARAVWYDDREGPSDIYFNRAR